MMGILGACFRKALIVWAVDLRHENVDEHQVEAEPVKGVKSVPGAFGENRVYAFDFQPCANR